jgi:hypothetical protein
MWQAVTLRGKLFLQMKQNSKLIRILSRQSLSTVAFMHPPLKSQSTNNHKTPQYNGPSLPRAATHKLAFTINRIIGEAVQEGRMKDCSLNRHSRRATNFYIAEAPKTSSTCSLGNLYFCFNVLYR